MEPAFVGSQQGEAVEDDPSGASVLAGKMPVFHILELEAAEKHLEEVGFKIRRDEEYVKVGFYDTGTRKRSPDGVRLQIGQKALTAIEAERLLLDSGYLTR